MSWQSVDLVLKKSKTRGSNRLIMLTIAHHTNSERGVAYPSIQTIAREANIDRSSVHRLLPELVEMGELEIMHRQGRNGTNLYKITIEELEAAINETTESDSSLNSSFDEDVDYPFQKKYRRDSSDHDESNSSDEDYDDDDDYDENSDIPF